MSTPTISSKLLIDHGIALSPMGNLILVIEQLYSKSLLSLLSSSSCFHIALLSHSIFRATLTQRLRRQLTKSLLKRDFRLDIELPNDRLCPPVRRISCCHLDASHGP